ncbi:hypothetical protein B7463_g10412, partial [Scytalidium lignicola]
MDPLSITGTLIAILQVTGAVISICYDYRQGSKNASREIIKISDELNSLKDVLDALLRVVENAQSGDPTKLLTFELLAKPDGPLITCKIELEQLKAKLEPEKGWRAVRQSLVWPLKEGDMRKTLSSLERLKSTIQLALSTDQTALSLALRHDVKDLTDIFHIHNADQERQRIYQWLKAPDVFAKHSMSWKKRQPETGNWLLTNKRYEHWLYSSSSFLWLYGIPGSGKTVLCSTIIEHIVRHRLQIPRSALAYFYFDFNDSGKRDISSLVRSLITQLSAQYNTMPPPLLLLYDQHKNGVKTAKDAKSVNDEALKATFRDLVAMFQNVYVVLDALDESSNCEELLHFIEAVRKWELPQLHLLTSSRQQVEIEESMEKMFSNKICLQDSEIRQDIRIYISDKLGTDKTLLKLPAHMRNEIRRKMVAGEGGMFQWVVCQFDMLQQCMTVASIKRAMTAGLPKSLDDTYDQILLRVNDIYQPEAMKVLKALTVASDLLTLEEIVEILAVDLESVPPHFDPDNRLLDPQNILTMCSSLVSSISPNVRRQVPALKLAHASVADYLTQQKLSSYPQFHFSKHSARQFLAQACLVYLMNPEFAEGHDSGRLLKRLEDFPFLMHAAMNWPLYLRKEPGDPEDHIKTRTKELVQSFFATHKMPKGGNFLFWVGLLIPDSPDNYILNTHPLYYAASYGLLEVVRIIIDTENDIDIDALGGRAHSSALHVATYRHHYDVVELLLERGANPNLPNHFHETPLYFANDEIEELLIQHGAKLVLN